MHLEVSPASLKWMGIEHWSYPIHVSACVQQKVLVGCALKILVHLVFIFYACLVNKSIYSTEKSPSVNLVTDPKHHYQIHCIYLPMHVEIYISPYLFLHMVVKLYFYKFLLCIYWSFTDNFAERKPLNITQKYKCTLKFGRWGRGLNCTS